VAERDRDRRAELVRGVDQEQLLLLKQPQVFLRHALQFFHRREPLKERGLPPPPVPDHRQEHQRDQRDLDQVVGFLLTVHHLPHDDAPGCQRHHGHRQNGGLQPPHPKPVYEGQAHPDDQEGDRRPRAHLAHTEQVHHDEHRPDDVHPRGPHPAPSSAEPLARRTRAARHNPAPHSTRLSRADAPAAAHPDSALTSPAYGIRSRRMPVHLR
jgi:hypothetical protein